jgi:hypothetical protein
MPVTYKPGVYPQSDGGYLIVTPSEETASGTRSRWLTKEQFETVLNYFDARIERRDESVQPDWVA